MDVLDAIHEHRQMKPFMDKVENAVNGKLVDKVKQEPIINEDVAQKEFQKELQKNIEPPAPKKEEAVVEEEQPQIQQGDLEP